METITELENGDFLAEIPSGSGRFCWYNRDGSGKVRYVRMGTEKEAKEIIRKQQGR